MNGFPSLSSLKEVEALAAVRRTMSTICGSRRYLLKVVLAGKAHWMAAARQSFGSQKASGVPDDTLEAMWAYFVHQAGPASLDHLKAELGVLLEAQQIEEGKNSRDVEWEILRSDGAVMDKGGRAH